MYSAANRSRGTDNVVAGIRVSADGFYEACIKQTIWVLCVAALELWTADTLTRIAGRDALILRSKDTVLGYKTLVAEPTRICPTRIGIDACSV